jgi:c-di-GMP-binding flagellar brake protein YcgR
MNEDTVDSPAGNASAALTPEAVPVGTPLDWPIADGDGTLLFDAGAVLVSIDERRFLFEHFRPQRADLLAPAHPGEPGGTGDAEPGPLGVKDMHLTIGALIGVRTQPGSAGLMHPCRIIGFAPNQALFATPPMLEGHVVPLRASENIEIVAIASHAVFRFVCTVEAVCQLPFHYLVLSRPGTIRRLRERKSIRVRAHIPVRYGLGASGDRYDGIGLAKGISAGGMSLAASWTLGQVGERIRVSFPLKSKELDIRVDASALIRNLQHGTSGEPVVHGLEFDQLTNEEQMAMKVFVFDRQDDVLYWTNGAK